MGLCFKIAVAEVLRDVSTALRQQDAKMQLKASTWLILGERGRGLRVYGGYPFKCALGCQNMEVLALPHP